MDRALRLKGALTRQKFVVKLFKIFVKESASKDASSNTWRREGKVKYHKETSSKISNHLCMAAMTKRNWYQRNWVWRSITNFFLSTTSPQTPSFLSKNSLVIFFSWLTSCYSYWCLDTGILRIFPQKSWIPYDSMAWNQTPEIWWEDCPVLSMLKNR